MSNRSRPQHNGRTTTKERPRALPADPATEVALLGALLNRPEAIPAAGHLDPADHYAPAHQTIHRLLNELHDQDLPCDPIAVAAELEARHQLDLVGGRQKLAELVQDAGITTSVSRYADVIAEHARQRRLIHGLTDALDKAKEGDTETARRILGELDAATGPTGVIPWEDVAAAVRGEVDDIKPEILERTDGQALIYPGLTHWLMGEPGKGKTWIALAAVAEQLLAGQCVIYLDWEGNRRIIASRLRALGVPADIVEGWFLYWRPPTLTQPLSSLLAAAVETTHATLVILDGVAKAVARQGLNEDKAADVLHWLELCANPMAEAGAAVFMLDHVTKDKDARNLTPRGSGAKLGEVTGAAWVVKPREGFSRQRSGRMDLIQAKDREGYVGVDGDTVASIRFDPTDNGDTLTITVEAPVAGLRPPGDPLVPTILMERVCRVIEGLNAVDVHPTANDIIRQTPGKKQYVTDALRHLILEGHVFTTPGPRNAIHHTAQAPYREANDPRSQQYEPDPEPDTDGEF